VAYADNLKKWSFDIKSFVTLDQEIIGKANEIRQETGIEVREPSST
jgi:hypothetical protein